jgi:tetratricopeptide (TPR) repeat protein
MRYCVLSLVVALGVGSGWLVWQSFGGVSELGRARDLAVTGRPEAAVGAIKALQAGRPQSAELAYLLAVAYRRLGDMEMARLALKRAERLGWPPSELRWQNAMIEVQSRRLQEAERRLLDMMLHEKCNDDVAVQVLECYTRANVAEGRFAEAACCLDFWFEWQPDSWLARRVETEVWEAIEKKPELEEEYRAVLAMEASQRNSVWRAYVLLRFDLSQAKEQFERHLRTWPDDAIARAGYAKCLRRLKSLPGSTGRSP